MNDQSIVHDVKAVEGKRVYFGHQSVGTNVLDGVRELLKGRKDLGLKIVELDGRPDLTGPFLAESRIGKNGDPRGKCDEFGVRVLGLPGGPPDIAAMKFCYVDFKKETQVDSLFSYYRAMVDSLRAKAPGVTIVHVTVPLTVRTPGWKKFVKKLLAKEESSDILNSRRCEFNEMVRRQYNGEPIFDLEAVESTHPDGSREEFLFEGKPVYALIDELSDDGAHLNETGRTLAAREFLRTLAAAAGRRAQ